MNSTLRKLVIIPCFNEAGNLPSLLPSVREALPDWDLVLVDDGSEDHTAELARGNVTLLPLPVNLGIGSAVQTGLRYAYEQGYDFAAQLDGDGQHPPSELPKLLAHHHESKANIVIGSRFINYEGFQSTVLRRVGIGLIRRLIFLLTGTVVSDPTSGFRLLDRRAIDVFHRDYPEDYPEPVSLAVAHQHQLAVSEIPVTMKHREHGKSSINGLKSTSYMFRVCMNLCFVRLRRFLG